MNILGIDPGPDESAIAIIKFDPYHGKWPTLGIFGKYENRHILNSIELNLENIHGCCIEQAQNHGHIVGRDVYETIWWSGRFYELAEHSLDMDVVRMKKPTINVELCGISRATNSQIVASVTDEFEPCGGGKNKRKGTKRNPGPLYGVSGQDVYDAMAAAIAFYRKIQAQTRTQSHECKKG